MASKIPLSKWQIILIAFGLGVVVMLLGSFVNIQDEAATPLPVESSADRSPESKSREQWTMRDWEDHYENTVKDILEQIVGVGEVSVMVNIDSSEERVYQKDLRTGTQVTNERDNQGGNRTIDDKTRDETVVTVSSGSGEQPIVVKTLKPKIRGVVVVASGVENTQVKALVFDVIRRALDVPGNQISIVPKKKN